MQDVAAKGCDHGFHNWAMEVMDNLTSVGTFFI